MITSEHSEGTYQDIVARKIDLPKSNPGKVVCAQCSVILLRYGTVQLWTSNDTCDNSNKLFSCGQAMTLVIIATVMNQDT